MGLRQSTPKRKDKIKKIDSIDCSVTETKDGCSSPTFDFVDELEESYLLNSDIPDNTSTNACACIGETNSSREESPTFESILFARNYDEAHKNCPQKSSLQEIRIDTSSYVDNKEIWRHTFDFTDSKHIRTITSTRKISVSSGGSRSTFLSKNRGLSTWPCHSNERLFLPNYSIDVQKVGMYEVYIVYYFYYCYMYLYV